jgi:hypothetical protein
MKFHGEARFVRNEADGYLSLNSMVLASGADLVVCRDDVGRGHRRAVVELHVGPELDRHGELVRGDLRIAGRDVRDHLGEVVRVELVKKAVVRRDRMQERERGLAVTVE